jgi:hypothetical protein
MFVQAAAPADTHTPSWTTLGAVHGAQHDSLVSVPSHVRSALSPVATACPFGHVPFVAHVRFTSRHVPSDAGPLEDDPELELLHAKNATTASTIRARQK